MLNTNRNNDLNSTRSHQSQYADRHATVSVDRGVQRSDTNTAHYSSRISRAKSVNARSGPPVDYTSKRLKNLRNEINQLAEEKKRKAIEAMKRYKESMHGAHLTPFTSTAASGFTGERRRIPINNLTGMTAAPNKMAKTSDNFATGFNKTATSFFGPTQAQTSTPNETSFGAFTGGFFTRPTVTAAI